MSHSKWHIGCSGFYYKDWKEVFYPKDLPQSKWFQFYAEHFNTLELNVTFYRFPQLKFLQNWYDKAPENFSFSAKVPAAITHYKQFNETEKMLNDFYTTVKNGLKEKAGCILFQMPPRLLYTPEKLEKMIAQVDDSFTNVFEFRNVSWWQQEVYKKLKKHNIIFCGHSHPTLPDDVVINNTTCYYRFHGVPKLYYSEYEKEFLKKVFDQISSDKKIKRAFIYFNNTATLAALNNAKYIQGLI